MAQWNASAAVATLQNRSIDHIPVGDKIDTAAECERWHLAPPAGPKPHRLYVVAPACALLNRSSLSVFMGSHRASRECLRAKGHRWPE